jgi:DNA-binding NtrC family response regulator
MPGDSVKPFGVLVVDDEPDMRELLTDFFRARALPVASAADGRAAIAQVERSPSQFRLILTDLKLPGCDGLEVLACARRVNPSAAVVILTGYASLDSAIQAVRLGAYDYLTKPFALGQLEILLKRVVDRFALETENRPLARLADRREPFEGAPGNARLDSLERRVARLEALTKDLVGSE